MTRDTIAVIFKIVKGRVDVPQAPFYFEIRGPGTQETYQRQNAYLSSYVQHLPCNERRFPVRSRRYCASKIFVGNTGRDNEPQFVNQIWKMRQQQSCID